MNKQYMLLSMLILIVLTLPIHAQLTITGKSCQGNQICDAQRTCDIETQQCTVEYSNCEPCGTTTVSCPLGTASAPKICQKSAGGAECVDGQPICADLKFTEPTALATFSVFVSKDIEINVEPLTQSAVAGQPVNYKVTLKNKNPKDLLLNMVATVPTGWTSDFPQETTIGPSQQEELTLVVTSSEGAAQGEHVISLGLFNEELEIFSSVKLKYIIALQGPPGLTITPQSQEGPPGSTQVYTISVTNTDPADFDASTITFDTVAPEGWVVELADQSLEVDPKETKSTTLRVTAPAAVPDGGTFSVGVNATANGYSAVGFAQFEINLCGDGICQLAEVCSEDCVAETQIICNGRCEKEVDDGVRFKATVAFRPDPFLVCDHTVDAQACIAAYQQDNCNGTGACLCSSKNTADCKTQCVDTKGAYYMLTSNAQGVVQSNANYSYLCPFVDLADLQNARDTFATALDSYEQSKSSYDEQIASAESPTERAKLQPCSDALELVVQKSKIHLSAFDDVLSHPSKSGAARIRARNAEIRGELADILKNNCEGAEGLLQFGEVTAPQQAVKGDNAQASIMIKNVGKILYYGYAQCDFIAPSNAITTVKTACTPFPANAAKTFTATTNIAEDGDWKLQCQLIGSLKSDCSSTIHDQTGVLEFGAATKEIFVSDVTGICDFTGITCDVTASSAQACTICSINEVACTKVSQEGTKTTFSCPRQGGFEVNLTGEVFPTANCIPIEPKTQTIQVSCPGCGNGIIEQNEQCELSSTEQCSQTTFVCDGKRQGVRGPAGFCTPTCTCSADPFVFSCEAGVCGADCSDGEVKQEVVDGVSYVRQCLDTCLFSDLVVETPPTQEGTGDLSVTSDPDNAEVVLDDMPKGTTPVTVTALAAGYYDLKVKKDGYYSYQNTTLVEANKETQIHAILESSANPPSSGSDACYVNIQSSSCIFDKSTNRYVVKVSVNWTNGDHAHVSVEQEGDGPKQYETNFTHESQQGAPGFKSVKTEVHDAQDDVRCSAFDQIYCGVGSTSGKLVEVLRDMPSITPVGNVTVQLQVIALQNVGKVEILEYVEPLFSPRSVIIKGNTTPVTISGPNTITDTKPYSAYTFTTTPQPGKPINITYTISTVNKGSYSFVSLAKFQGQETRNEAMLSVTNCQQTIPVVAVDEFGNCQNFETACDVDTTQGWTIVSQCPQEGDVEPAQPQGDSLFLIVGILLVIIIAGVAYYKREEIMEKIEEWRERE